MAYMSLDEKKMVVRVPIPQCKVRKRHNLFLAYGEKAIRADRLFCGGAIFVNLAPNLTFVASHAGR